MGRFLFYTALFILFFLVVRSVRNFFRSAVQKRNNGNDIHSSKPENKKPSQIDKNKVVDADYEDL
jgi:hypothetical protein